MTNDVRYYGASSWDFFEKLRERFFGKRKPTVWQILPTDIRWLGFETSFVLKTGWEPFGVSPVPNTLDPNQIRLWLRRPEDSKSTKTWEIRIQQAGWGGHQVLLHLTEHWEPFAVSISPPDQPLIWFRKPSLTQR